MTFSPLVAAVSDFINWWLLGTGFFFLIFWAAFSAMIRGIQSRTWPSTTGTVVTSGVRANYVSDSGANTSGSTNYQPDVKYTYEVDGKQQQSNQISFVVFAGSKEHAETTAAKYPVGKQVTVYHHPKLHYLAVLDRGHYVTAAILALITGAVFYFVAAMWLSRSLHPHAKDGPWKHTSKPQAMQFSGDRRVTI